MMNKKIEKTKQLIKYYTAWQDSIKKKYNENFEKLIKSKKNKSKYAMIEQKLTLKERKVIKIIDKLRSSLCLLERKKRFMEKNRKQLCFIKE